MKLCPCCKVEKPVDQYTRASARKDGLEAYCKPCCSEKRKRITARQRSEDIDGFRARRRAYTKTYRENNPERVAELEWRQSLKARYGISHEEYLRMSDVQGGVCAVCGKAEPGKRLVVDHDHDTGAVRGLLCGGCNLAIGALGDSVEGLMRAVSYLERGRE